MRYPEFSETPMYGVGDSRLRSEGRMRVSGLRPLRFAGSRFRV